MNLQIFSGNDSFVVTFLASFLIWIMFASFFIFWLIGKKVTKKEAYQIIIASFLSWAISEAIKYIFPTNRPFMLNGLPPLTLTVPTDPAFPSSHSALAFGLATGVFTHHKKMGVVLLSAALLVAVSRVAANVHTPNDVVGGALIGSLPMIIFKGLL
jgi:undecaprenyl-diphosphatase